MKKLLSIAFLSIITTVTAQEEEVIKDSLMVDIFQTTMDSIANSFTYEYKNVDLNNGMATIKVPKGYKFLNAEQSQKVLTDLWGNPPSETLGMLFPESITPMSDNFTYAVEITYSEEGYIDDEDAKDIDYAELLEEMQEEANNSNPERIKQGYQPISLVGWASKPFYDADNKKLHWAKELKFGESEINTLNYNIRVLGRKGFLNLNVIGDMDALPMVKEDVNQVLASVDFNDGYKYSDFNPDLDEVAAYGIGGLIAGKVLVKVGFFAALLKFWKIIAVAAVGGFSLIRKRLFGEKGKSTST